MKEYDWLLIRLAAIDVMGLPSGDGKHPANFGAMIFGLVMAAHTGQARSTILIAHFAMPHMSMASLPARRNR
jgi:hypothetical protein